MKEKKETESLDGGRGLDEQSSVDLSICESVCIKNNITGLGKLAQSFRRTQFNFQNPYNNSQLFITPAPRDPIPFSDLLGDQACIQYTYIHVGKTYKIKINV